jgi:hypothetical protein
VILEGTERFSVQQEGLSRLPPKKGMFAKENFLERGGFMRPISIVVLMIGVFLLGVSSCATVPTKPLAPGEVRLLSIVVPEKEKIRVNLPFVVDISFEADGQPEIKTACFYFAGDGPHCFKVTDVDYGPPGTIKVQIYSKNPGSRLLECYVLYIRDGKNQPTNVVSTYFRPVPQ